MAIETSIKKAGYKYYVYVQPGQIEYFFDYQAACEYADAYNAQVSEVDI